MIYITLVDKNMRLMTATRHLIVLKNWPNVKGNNCASKGAERELNQDINCSEVA